MHCWLCSTFNSNGSHTYLCTLILCSCNTPLNTPVTCNKTKHSCICALLQRMTAAPKGRQGPHTCSYTLILCPCNTPGNTLKWYKHTCIFTLLQRMTLVSLRKTRPSYTRILCPCNTPVNTQTLQKHTCFFTLLQRMTSVLMRKIRPSHASKRSAFAKPRKPHAFTCRTAQQQQLAASGAISSSSRTC
jgi:hypothetical protein